MSPPYSKIRGWHGLFRLAIHPQINQAGIFAAEKMVGLVLEDDGTLVTSLEWQRFAPTISHVHAAGCRLARERTEKLKARPKYKEKDRRVYTGAFYVTAKSLWSIVGAKNLPEVSKVEVFHDIEGLDIAHATLKITLTSDAPDPAATGTAVAHYLWHNAFRGPAPHFCEEDLDLADAHPGPNLPKAPSGAYADNRWRLSKTWDQFRFDWTKERWEAIARDLQNAKEQALQSG